jgi:hypothetical protein
LGNNTDKIADIPTQYGVTAQQFLDLSSQQRYVEFYETEVAQDLT